MRNSTRWFALLGAVLLPSGVFAQGWGPFAKPRPTTAPQSRVMPIAQAPQSGQSRITPVAQTAPPPLAKAPTAPAPTVQAQTAQVAPTQTVTEELTPAQKELQQLLAQLTTLSDTVVKQAETPQGWQYQLQQADLLLRIVARAEAADQENWLKMAIDSYHAASVSSPQTEKLAHEKLSQVSAYIQQYYPQSKLAPYAALQEVRADHLRQLGKEGMDREKAQDSLYGRLLKFADTYIKTTEGVEAVREAAKISETRGRKDEACDCYRMLANNYAGTDTGRLARASLKRLGGMNGETVTISLPYLFSGTAEAEEPFSLKEKEGRLVIVYFWSASESSSEEGFTSIKRAMDNYRRRGLDVLYVNTDEDSGKARQFLSGKLTAGVHVHLKDGLKSALAEKYGLDKVPTMLVVGPEGKLASHSVSASDIESLVSEKLPASGKRGDR